MTDRDAAYLRGQLASVGIVLDPATTAAAPSAGFRPTAPEPGSMDRDEVRAILIAAGAPVADLEWLVESCPSIEDAKGYRPPARQAWCARCDEVTACDQQGCLTCRGDR